MPRIRPSSDDRDYPHDGGYLEEDYRMDQLRFAEAPKTGGEKMSGTGIGDLSTDEVHDAIKQGVFDAFAGLLVQSPFNSPRADLLLSVERGVQEAFEKIGTTADVKVTPKRSKPFIEDSEGGQS